MASKLLRMCWNEKEEASTITGSVPSCDFVDVVVGYALTCKMHLPASADTTEEARYQARLDQRGQVTAKDIQAALLNYRIPSDQALREAFTACPSRRWARFSSLARALQSHCKRLALS